MKGSGPHRYARGARGQRNAGEVDQARCAGRPAGASCSYQKWTVASGSLAASGLVVGAQGVVGGGAVGVHDGDRGAVPGPARCASIASHRGARRCRPRPAAAGCGKRPSRTRSPYGAETVPATSPTLHARVEVVGDLAVGAAPSVCTRFTVICAQGRAGRARTGCTGVSAGRRPGSVDLDGDVLARRGSRRTGAPSARAQPEGGDVRGLLATRSTTFHSRQTSPRRARSRVQPLLDGDEGVGHQPVDLVPGGGDLGRDGVAEHLGDGGEQVLVDDAVLLAA